MAIQQGDFSHGKKEGCRSLHTSAKVDALALQEGEGTLTWPAGVSATLSSVAQCHCRPTLATFHMHCEDGRTYEGQWASRLSSSGLVAAFTSPPSLARGQWEAARHGRRHHVQGPFSAEPLKDSCTMIAMTAVREQAGKVIGRTASECLKLLLCNFCCASLARAEFLALSRFINWVNTN